jgi:hypothetical protein
MRRVTEIGAYQSEDGERFCVPCAPPEAHDPVFVGDLEDNDACAICGGRLDED